MLQGLSRWFEIESLSKHVHRDASSRSFHGRVCLRIKDVSFAPCYVMASGGRQHNSCTPNSHSQLALIDNSAYVDGSKTAIHNGRHRLWSS